VAVPVAPGEEDPAALVIVGLEVVHDLENRGREGPDVALPGLWCGGVVDLVDPPVVGLAVLAAQCVQGHLVVRDGLGQGQGVGVCAEVDLMPGRLPARPPVEQGVHGHVSSPRLGLRRTGTRGDLEEPHLAEAVDTAPAPGAQAGQSHVLGHCAAQIHGGVVHVVALAGRLGELGHIGDLCPGGPVCGDLDLGLLDAVPQHLLQGLVGVPDPHLVELEGAVEVILDPGGLWAGLAADPHGGDFDRVLVRVGIQPQPADRVGRSHLVAIVHETGGRGRRRRDRIGVGLDGEAPRGALEHGRGRGRCIDLVDPPIVGLAQSQSAGWDIATDIQSLDQRRPQRIRDGSLIDIVELGPDVDVVGMGKLTRRPAQHGIRGHIRLSVAGLRIAAHVSLDEWNDVGQRIRVEIRIIGQHESVDPEAVLSVGNLYRVGPRGHGELNEVIAWVRCIVAHLLPEPLFRIGHLIVDVVVADPAVGGNRDVEGGPLDTDPAGVGAFRIDIRGAEDTEIHAVDASLLDPDPIPGHPCGGRIAAAVVSGRYGDVLAAGRRCILDDAKRCGDGRSGLRLPPDLFGPCGACRHKEKHTRDQAEQLFAHDTPPKQVSTGSQRATSSYADVATPVQGAIRICALPPPFGRESAWDRRAFSSSTTSRAGPYCAIRPRARSLPPILYHPGLSRPSPIRDGP